MRVTPSTAAAVAARGARIASDLGLSGEAVPGTVGMRLQAVGAQGAARGFGSVSRPPPGPLEARGLARFVDGSGERGALALMNFADSVLSSVPRPAGVVARASAERVFAYCGERMRVVGQPEAPQALRRDGRGSAGVGGGGHAPYGA